MRSAPQDTSAGPAAAGRTAAHGPAGPETDWMVSVPLQIRPDVEVITGIDDRPLLYNSATGRYLALTPAGVRMLDLLDGSNTGGAILDRLTAHRDDRETARARVGAFLDDLRQAGVLTVEPREPDRRSKIMKFSLREHMPRLKLTGRVGHVMEPLATLLRRLPVRVLNAAVLATALAGMVVGLYALLHPVGHGYPALWWTAMPILIVQVIFHEAAHALVCQYLRAPIREAGIGLMLYFMPVAYVDRTDAYRVRSRGGRVMIALAGPLNDQVWYGAAGVVALTVPGQVGDIAYVLLVLQTMLTVVNLNPLLPSDGYHAITAASGAVNLRGRAFAYLAHVALRSPLPSGMHALGRWRRAGYLLFGALCLLYAVGLAVLVLRNLWNMIGGIV
ncbi:PqqD family peptide modification chaperone [Streptosporangium sandarakinum]|uniref:PqqD family peptide modification chaperone n=1 Tax=Streptosporangium sandarakinum TaxID=1260955 RepID=UPI00371A3E73